MKTQLLNRRTCPYVPVFKRGLLALSTFVLFFVSALAQTNLQDQQVDWATLMVQPDANFFEVQEAFHEEWDGKPYVRGKGWKQFYRWENFWEGRILPDGSFPKFKDGMRAYREYMVQRGGGGAGNWLPLGPFDHNATGSWSPGQGRVNVIVEDPNDANTIYIGAPAGGIWKSTDNAATWTPIGDDISVIGISGIAVDYNNSNVIYISTGDADGGDTYSVGVMKSTDGGTTWNNTGNIAANTTNKIVIDPTNSNVVYVAGSTGIFKTTNGGTSWTNIRSGNFDDVKLKPGTPSTVYGVTEDEFHYSTNSGTTWNTATGLPNGSGRLAMAVTPANNNYVYILSADGGWGYNGVYRSTNSGVSFSARNTNTDVLESNQAWFDLAIAVSATDANQVFTGCLNVWRSNNGGSSFSQLNDWNNPGGNAYTHADIHYLTSFSNRIYCGSDGGIYRSTNGGNNFTDLTTGLQIGQFYRIGGSQNDPDVISGGLQDNGGYAWTNGSWKCYHGADGMEGQVDPNNSDLIFGMIQFGGLYYSTNGGFNLNNAGSPESGRWVTPMEADPNLDRIVAGYNDLHEYDYGTGWNQLSTFNFPAQIKNLKVYQGNSNTIVVSTNQSIYRTTNNGGAFTDITNNLSGFLGNQSGISSIDIHPTDPDQIWVSIEGWSAGNKAAYTNDGGATWTNVSNNLPNLPCNVIKYEAGSNGGIYVGLDIGVYYTDNNLGGSWLPFNNQLPNVIVRDLEINATAGLIRAGTYGRGVWTSATYNAVVIDDDAGISDIITPLDGSTECNATSITPEVELRNYGNDPLTSVTINYDLDGGPNQTFAWTGNLTTGATANVTLPTMAVTPGAHTFNASTSNPNGNADGNTGNDANASNFTISSGSQITLTVNTDCWGYETYWEILNQGTATVVASGGNSIVPPGGQQIAQQTDPDAYGNEATITENLCLAVGCYDFVIYDDYGDGMHGSQYGSCTTDGSYTIEDDQANVLAQTIAANADFGNSETNQFCVSSGCPTITTNASATDASCNGVCDGTITASGAGGQAPYTYSWDNGVGGGATHNNLCAGTYTVTVTDDNGCTGVSTVVINEPTGVTLNISSTDASCNGVCDGSVSVVGAGGTPPYAYSWTGGLGGGGTHNNVCAGTYTATVTDANGCTAQGQVTVNEPSALSASASATDASCNGVCDGSVTVSGSGGTPPYAYSWTGGLGGGGTHNNVCAGSYTVTVTDANGCTTQVSVTVNEPAAIFLNAASIDASCNGVCDGSVTALATGGTPPFSYSWTGGLGGGGTHNNVCAGSYSVTATDANGCTAQATVTVNEPTGITLNMSTVDASCGQADGQACATAVGGTPPYTYLWDAGAGNQTTACAINLAAGTYSVTVTDANGCTAQALATVGNSGGPTVTINTTDASCNGTCDGAATATATGGTPPYTYLWSPGGQTTASISNVCAGSYTVTVTDANGCVVNASATISEPAAFGITGSTTDEMQGGDGAVDITVTGGTTPYSFAWTPGGQTTEDISGLTAGSYTVTVTDANQCVSQPETFIVGTQVGITGLGLEQGISIYPNPTEGEFMLEVLTALSGELQVKVTDVRGRLLHHTTVNVSGAHRQRIDLTHEENGMYFIHVMSGEEQVVRKVMKQ